MSEQPLPEPRMPPKKKVNDFPTEQFLRAVKHWTDSFVAGEIKVGIFLNSLQDEAHSFCKSKFRFDEWEEFIQDFMEEDDQSSGSHDIISIDENEEY